MTDTVIVTANHAGPRHETDAEMVVIVVKNGTATFEQPDGQTWTFDYVELISALTAPLATHRGLAA